jgi:4-amino-4-deoxy-L-arabinose transferase-like glycosyltransferase
MPHTKPARPRHGHQGPDTVATVSPAPAKIPPTAPTPSTADVALRDQITEGTLNTWAESWAHCHATLKRLEKRGWLTGIGLSSAILAGVLGVAILATWEQEFGTPVKITVGALTILAAALTATQTWLETRTKQLISQQRQVHDLHREIEAAHHRIRKAPIDEASDARWLKTMDSINADYNRESTEAFDKEWAQVVTLIRSILTNDDLPVPRGWPGTPN